MSDVESAHEASPEDVHKTEHDAASIPESDEDVSDLDSVLEPNPLCPWTVGSNLTLCLKTPYEGQTVQATITKTFEFTLSCVMVVTVQSEIPGIAGEMVLKLFDRRFAQRCRVDENIEDWSPEYEEAYHKFLSDGRAPDFISSLPPSSFDEDRENWDDGQYEAYCHHILNRLYNAEVETYETLQDLQGNDIPRLYARVTLPIPASFEDPSLQQWVDIPGILIEYLDGFDLTDLHQHAPKETWQSIGDEAMRIINVIGDRGILNTDVNRRSFNINPKDFKARMMDFGNCRFRRDFGSEDEWRSAQAHEDEEGAIGTMMQVKLGEISPGAFTYKRSAKYEQLDQDFMMEEV